MNTKNTTRINTPTRHYEHFLAKHYTWMSGGLDQKIKENEQLFQYYNVIPQSNKSAIDLGAGPGFQSIPLARLGFRVHSFDTSAALLAELRQAAEGLPVQAIEDDLMNFEDHLTEPQALVTCMGDTITHLANKDQVSLLFHKIFANLEKDGLFLLSYRPLEVPLEGLDRFLHVRSDEKRIFTCFLEYGPDNVIVNDLLYEEVGGLWNLYKSSYPKLRLEESWCVEALLHAGFRIQESVRRAGFLQVLAIR